MKPSIGDVSAVGLVLDVFDSDTQNTFCISNYLSSETKGYIYVYPNILNSKAQTFIENICTYIFVCNILQIICICIF